MTTDPDIEAFQKLRESFVPNNLRRLIKEEARLTLDFDGAKDSQERREVMRCLLAVRRLIAEWVGWPKAPAGGGKGRLPAPRVLMLGPAQSAKPSDGPDGLVTPRLRVATRRRITQRGEILDVTPIDVPDHLPDRPEPPSVLPPILPR